jgi:sec-independent protein translocase protein TatC
MANTQVLLLVGGLIGLLLVLPLLLAMILQRVLPVRQEAAATETAVAPELPSSSQFDGLGDFWTAMVPHLIELRNRLTKALGAVLLGMVIGFVLVLPQGPVNLVAVIIEQFTFDGQTVTGVQAVGTTETFASYMMVALTLGVIFAMPVIVYQIIAFVAPGLTIQEKRYVFIALPFITCFFLAGLLFGWFVTIPAALQFLLGFGDTTLIETKPSLRDFISTFTTLLLINGAIFELPLIIYVLALVGGVTPEFLAKNRRYAVLVIVIVAAIITPTGDPINLMLVAVPMYVLFEFGIVLARFAPRPAPAPAAK